MLLELEIEIVLTISAACADPSGVGWVRQQFWIEKSQFLPFLIRNGENPTVLCPFLSSLFANKTKQNLQKFFTENKSHQLGFSDYRESMWSSETKTEDQRHRESQGLETEGDQDIKKHRGRHER